VKPVLLLAADLLNHAADPSFAVEVNEMAAWRFRTAVDADDYLRSELLAPNLLNDGEETDVLPFITWIWLLQWRQLRRAVLDQVVLDGLTKEAVTEDRRLRLWVLVGQDALLNERVGSIDAYHRQAPTIRELPLRWLRDQVSAGASGRTNASELMSHLLQIASDVTLAALFELLQLDGVNRDQLRREARAHLDSYGLESSRLELWRARLGLPGDPPNH
jgi:hypothetical protein